MLRVSKLTDYGSVVLSHMARRPDETLSAAGIAEVVSLPGATVGKLLKSFAKSGLVASSRGKQGGYRLARKPRDISLVDIISALEGPIALTECSVERDICQLENQCEIREHWQGINRVIYRSLEQVSLEELLLPAEKLQAVTLKAPDTHSA